MFHDFCCASVWVAYVPCFTFTLSLIFTGSWCQLIQWEPKKKHVHTSKIMQMNRTTKNSLVNCFSLCPFDNSLRISRHEAKKIPTHTYTVRKRDIWIFFCFLIFYPRFQSAWTDFNWHIHNESSRS